MALSLATCHISWLREYSGYLGKKHHLNVAVLRQIGLLTPQAIWKRVVFRLLKKNTSESRVYLGGFLEFSAQQNSCVYCPATLKNSILCDLSL